MKFKILLLALVFFTACTPKYNQEAVNRTISTRQATVALYNKIIQSQDKNYTSYSDDYLIINAEVDILSLLNESRKNADVSKKIIGDIKARFNTYEGEHKAKGVINASEAQVYKNGMEALWKILYNTELNLNN